MARILVVEDDPVSRNLVRTILAKDDHDVTVCPGARDAIEALSFHAFDVVVTDIMMPERDGFEVIQAVRDLRPGTPVIILSAIDEKVPAYLTAAAFERLGVTRVIPKPVNPGLLASAVLAAVVLG